MDQDPAYLGDVSAADFGIRLGQLLNTFILGSQISTIVSNGESSTGRNNTASLTQLHEVYACSWSWLVVLVLASLTMLAASIYATCSGLQTRIPDVLGYCSSLTRDARYVDLCGGSTLHGMDRARLLKDYRIRLGVVEGFTDEGVGHIAVAPAHNARRPVKGEWYI